MIAQNKTTYHLLLYLSLGIGLLLSCRKEQEYVISGIMPLPPFDTIELEGVFDVELIQKDTHTLQYEGGERVTAHITYAVQDRRLTITNKNSGLWTHPTSHPPILFITSSQFAQIEIQESSSVMSRDTISADRIGVIMGSKLGFADLKVDCQLFYFWNASPSGGSIRLQGKTKFLHLYNSNLMAVDAFLLPCEYAIVETSSKGDVRVHVETQLNYSITGTGNIYLKGDPVDIFPGEITSTGRLLR